MTLFHFYLPFKILLIPQFFVQTHEKYNEAMVELLSTKENVLDLSYHLSNDSLKISELEAKIRELECELERAKLFQ